MEFKYIGIIVVLIIAIIYFSIKYYYREGKITVYSEGPIDLSVPTVVIDSDTSKKLLQSKNGSTISMFLKLDDVDKSGVYDATPINIVSQPGCWSFQYIPKNSGNASPTYKFVVRTIDSKGAEGEEVIPLAMLPEQKWIYFTVLKEGRRFDILYNDNIIASSYLTNYPKILTQNIQVGNSLVRGQIAYVNGASKRYTFEEIASERAGRSDTRGKPYLPDESILPTIGCPGGLFCFTAPSGPGTMTKFWSSPYA